MPVFAHLAQREKPEAGSFFPLLFPYRLGVVLAFSRAWFDEIGMMMGERLDQKTGRYRWSYMSILFLLMMGLKPSPDGD